MVLPGDGHLDGEGMKKIFVMSLGRLANALRILCTLLMVASIVAMAISVFVQIILRGVFQTTWLPLDDLVVYGFAIIVFAGTALVFQTNSHLATPIIGDYMSPRAKRVLDQSLDALCLLFLWLMLYEGIVYTIDGMSQFSPLLRVPIGLIFVTIPISAFASIVFIVHRHLTTVPLQD